MRIAMLASAGAIAFVCTIGSVSAADQFTTLKGVKTIPMSSSELSAIKGMDHHFGVMTPATTPNTVDGGPSDGLLDPPASDSSAPQTESTGQNPGRFETSHFQDSADGNQQGFFLLDGRLVAPSYHGLSKASCNPVIVMPGFANCL